MALKIHPGIGVARVGDSPNIFIGPETVDVPSTPSGGYRDAEGLIRRQAARFRLFDGSTHLVHGSASSITWTARLQGGVQSISGIEQRVEMTVGTTVVAELRTDSEGNLLVLPRLMDASTSGCCDGPVEATLTQGTTTTTAVSAWVTILPPDFAPGTMPRLPHHLLMLDWLVRRGDLTTPPAGVNVSFRREVYPAVRGRTTRTVAELLALATFDERRDAVPNYYTAPGEPSDIEGPYIRSIIQHYRDGEFDDDWSTPTPLVPDELDRGPLSFVDGSCPGYGWELSFFPIAAGTNPFAAGETLRFDPAVVSPGVTRPFVGWRGDLGPCIYEWATVAGSPGSGFGGDWQLRGFMVRSGGTLVYEDWRARIELLTTELHFGAVQRGSAVARTIELDIAGMFVPAPVVFSTPLPPRIHVLALTSTTPFAPEYGVTLSLPVLFKAEVDAPLGPLPPASLELEIDGRPFTIPISAEIVSARSAQLGLVVDCSYSMTEDRGDGISKFVGLKEAIEVLVDVARPDDGIAVAPFSDNALPTHTARRLGDGSASDSRREAVRAFVDDLVTVNNTSIGDGLISARHVFTLTPDSFDREALIVITDGVETAPAWIEDVASSIDEHTFAIGIGTHDNVDEEILTALTEGHEGYLLLTGSTISPANQYRLEKYLLQILAGATNEEVILDPTGTVLPGGVASIPIPVTDGEFRLDAIVVSNDAPELFLALMGPDGAVRPFEALAGEPGVQIVRRRRVGMARVPVPLSMLDGSSWGPGIWHLLIAQRAHVPRDAPNEFLATHVARRDRNWAVSAQGGKPVSYAAVVNARSAIRLAAHARHLSEPRSLFAVEATVGYAGVPLRMAPTVVAEVETPGGLRFEVPLEAAGRGRYLGQFEAVRPGTYVTRVRARGMSPEAHRFVRELTLTPSLSSRRRCARPCRPKGNLSERLRDVRAELRNIVSCFVRGERRKG